MLLFYITQNYLTYFLKFIAMHWIRPYITSKLSQHFVTVSRVLHVIITDCRKLKYDVGLG